MITTDRLTLRPWDVTDQASLRRILGDPDVMRYSDYGPLADAEQAIWLTENLSQGPDQTLPWSLAIERNRDKQVIGYIRLTSGPNRLKDGDAEFGVRLIKTTWHDGYATEAGHAILDAVRSVPHITRIIASVDPNNSASLRVLPPLGMHQDGEIMQPGYDHPDYLYVRHLKT